MSDYITKAGLKVAPALVEFIEQKALPGTGVAADQFWSGLDRLVSDMGPRNRDLLEKRETLQAQIDAWHIEHRGQVHDADAYRDFLSEIGGADHERPFCAERRECALGQSL